MGNRSNIFPNTATNTETHVVDSGGILVQGGIVSKTHMCFKYVEA